MRLALGIENIKLANYEDKSNCDCCINRNLTTSSLVFCFDSRP